MEELEEAPSNSLKMDQHGGTPEPADDLNAGVVNIKLPEQLQKITPAEEFVSVRHRWNTNEEIASILIAFSRHKEWLVLPQKIRPASGSMLLYNRKIVFYRRDGYCWKKRRNGSTIREDHMKLKVQGLECIYGSYVHSAILPTFHRRCYWLLQNPNIVLIHYLNVPYPEAAKPSIPSLSYELRQKEWSKEELVDQLRPMLSRVCHGIEHDAEEDQKVEKTLEEILPFLMQESNKLPLNQTCRPLAPAPTTTTTVAASCSTSPPTPSASSTPLAKRPLRKQLRTTQPQLGMAQPGLREEGQQVQHVRPVVPPASRVLTLQPSLLPAQALPSHSLQQEHEHPSVHSLNTPVLPHPGTTKDSTAAVVHSFGTTPNPIQVGVQGIIASSGHVIQQDSNVDFQIPTVVSSVANMPVYYRVGSDSTKDRTMNAGNVFSRIETSAPNLTTVTSPHPANSLTATGMHSKDLSSSSSMSVSYVQNQEAHTGHSDAGYPFLQQPYLQVAQPNHSYLQTQIDAQQQQMKLSQQQQQQQQQQHLQQPPVLTLHLKPTNSSSSDSPGFVLSLQGATIVSQHNDQQPPGVSGFNFTSTQSPSISNGQGVVLVASQNPAGGLVLNRISPNPQPIPAAPLNSFLASQNSAPGAPSNQSSSNLVLPAFAHQAQQQLTQAQFADAPTMTSAMLTQTEISTNSSQPFIYSSPMTTTGESLSQPQLHQQLQSGHQQQQLHPHFVNAYPTTTAATSSTNNSTFPAKAERLFPDNTNTIPFRTDFCSIKKDEPAEECSAGASSYGRGDMNSSMSMPLVNNTMTVNHHQPDFVEAVTQNDANSGCMFSLQHSGQQQQPPQSQLPPQTQSQTLQPPGMMAGPSGLNSCVKDMITNPNSCDTLDGSFSSLPSADLNLDDLLDLNDLDDVSDLGCSPFTPTDITEQPSDMSVVDKGVSDGAGTTMNLMAHGQNAVSTSGHLSPFSAVSNSLLYQQHQSHHQQHPLSQPDPNQERAQESLKAPTGPPTSPLHPGAPPRPTSSFPPMVLGSPSPSHPLSCNPDKKSQVSRDPEGYEINAVIRDFSPDWAYTKTNTKILVAGPWFSENSNYSCVFDGEHIPASLIQPGLLRCFTQYHSPGYATLQVARDGIVVSNCEVFEFCDRENRDSNTTHPEWFAIDCNQLKLLLVERLDQLGRCFVNLQTTFQQDPISDDMETLETSLIQQVHSMAGQAWSDANLYPKAGQHNLTLLHLAAGLGFAKLISCLIRWRMDNSCVALEFEVDAQNVDSHACTPLMWACVLGKIDAALTLYHWNASPLKMCNKDGLLPLTLARQKGHYNLANQVEQLERAKEQQQLKLQQQQQQQQQHESQHQGAGSSHNMDLTCSPSQFSQAHSADPAGGTKKDLELKDEVVDIHVTPSFSKPGKPGPKLIRRFSEQVINHQTRPLNKRNSVDLLPSGQDIDQATLPTGGSSIVREANSEPQLPVSPDMAFVASPAPRLLLEDKIDEPSGYSGEGTTSKMDTDELVTERCGSPIIDVERISSDEEVDANKEGSKHQMVTLANQIIAAIPERIKLSPSKGDDVDDASSGRGRSESHSSLPSQGSPRPSTSSFGDDSGISTPMTESLAFEEYRYTEFGTPASSLSPDSTCLPSPYSPYSFTLDSPPPTTAEFTEYFNAPTTYMEKDFSQLTLSDQEQRKLYEAAKVIQNAYRHYRDKQQQQQKEIEAAILIQSYYRRYKTYAYYKKMSHAAVLIQNQFRTYYAKRKKRGETGATARRESERLKKGRNQSVIIQQRFRSHYQRRSVDGKEGVSQTQGSGDAPDSSPPPPETNSQYSEGTPPADADADTVATEVSATATPPANVDGNDSSSVVGKGKKTGVSDDMSLSQDVEGMAFLEDANGDDDNDEICGDMVRTDGSDSSSGCVGKGKGGDVADKMG